MTRAGALATDSPTSMANRVAMRNTLRRRHLDFVMRRRQVTFVVTGSWHLLSHIGKDQAHVSVRDRGADAHVTDNSCHHTRRKFLRRRVAASAVRMKALLPLHPHGIGIRDLD